MPNYIKINNGNMLPVNSGQIPALIKEAITNEPIAGAVVYIIDQITRTYITDASGTITTDQLPWGSWKLKAMKNGFAASPEMPVQFRDNQILTYTFYLAPSPIVESTKLYGQRFADNSWQPVRTNNHHGLITSNMPDLAIRSGSSYSGTTGIINLDSKSFAAMKLSNTSTEVNGFINLITISSNADASCEFFCNGSLVAPGTSIVPVNNNFQYGSNSIIDIA